MRSCLPSVCRSSLQLFGVLHLHGVKGRILVILASCLCVSGCGGGSTSNGTASSLSGTWQFSASSTLFVGNTTTGTATLTQSGNSVTGTVTLNGSPCATSGTLNGSVSGSTFTFTVQEESQAVTFTGQLNSGFTSASGDYIAPAGGCTNGDQGNWTATKM